MTLSKYPSSEEAANPSDQGKSSESLAKTKDGSMFAAKARAAELNATRARKAAAKHAHLLTDDDIDNDVPRSAPVPLGSLRLTRSRSRGSNAWKPPNNLTELPEATAENKVNSPSPQHHPPQLLQRPSIPHQNFKQSTSCLDLPQLPATPSSRSGKASVSTDKPPVADWQTEIFESSPHQPQQIFQYTLHHTQPALQQSSQYLTPPHVPTPRRSLQQASPTTINSQPPEYPLRAPHLDMPPQYTRVGSRDPNAYTSPRHLAVMSNHKSSIISSPSRTVAHDPLAGPQTTRTSLMTTRSTLKPEAAVYTPQSTQGKGPQPCYSATGKQHLDDEILEARYNAIVSACDGPNSPILSQTVDTSPNATQAAQASEAAGNIGMASLISKPRRQTLEEVVESFRTNSMDREFEAMKQRLETRTNAMTASLATDSIPDVDSVAAPQPKPIGYGRPSITATSSTTACMSDSRYEDLDKRVGSDIIANTIANLMLHKSPTLGDRLIRYRNAHACEVHQGPDGNKSLFDPDWGTPPSRVARDPRRLGRDTYHEDPMRLCGAGSASGSASGSISGAFGRR